MNSLKCLIDGADFVDQENDRWIHGSLHQLYDIMIFDMKDNIWRSLSEHPLNPNAKAMRAQFFSDINGLIIFPLLMTEFNSNANRFLNENLNAAEANAVHILDPHGGRLQ